jgi:hypothetical protein
VSVSVAEFALADIGPENSKRPVLVGAAYQRAEAALRECRAGVAAVDAQTFAALPTNIRARFVLKGGHAELR